MATRITLSGGTQYEVTNDVTEVSDIVSSGWTGTITVSTTAGANVLLKVPQVTSVQAT